MFYEHLVLQTVWNHHLANHFHMKGCNPSFSPWTYAQLSHLPSLFDPFKESGAVEALQKKHKYIHKHGYFVHVKRGPRHTLWWSFFRYHEMLVVMKRSFRVNNTQPTGWLAEIMWPVSPPTLGIPMDFSTFFRWDPERLWPVRWAKKLTGCFFMALTREFDRIQTRRFAWSIWSEWPRCKGWNFLVEMFFFLEKKWWMIQY